MRRLSLLVVALGLASCSGSGEGGANDPNQGVRWTTLQNGSLEDCIHMTYIESVWGATISGPYTPFALRDFIRDTEGRTYRSIATPSGDNCGQEIGYRLRNLCYDEWVCSRYGDRALCLYAIEDAFRRPFPYGMCDVCGDGYCAENEAVRPDEGGLRAVCPEDCTCGNGVCEPRRGENLYACPTDCPSACGDGLCTGGEICGSCPEEGSGVSEPIIGFFGEITMPCQQCTTDCCSTACGDRVCLAEAGESAENCPQDCAVTSCGDGVCIGLETATNCPVDCETVSRTCGDYCRNGACGPFSAELEKKCDTTANCLNCPGACADPREACGDGVCMGCEVWTCRLDCSDAEFGHCFRNEETGELECPDSFCGDRACDGDVENRVTCPQDCPYDIDPVCNDGVCTLADLFSFCPMPDCTPGLIPATCGDGYCMRGEAAQPGEGVVLVCPEDCGGMP